MVRVEVVTRTLPPEEVPEANPWDTDRFWTVPNILSVIRLIGVPVFLWLALGPHEDGWAVAVLAVAGITDWLDGKIARCWHQISRIGQMLDPIADRLYIFATVIALTLRDVIPQCTSSARRPPSACCIPSRWSCWGISEQEAGRSAGSSGGPSPSGERRCTGGPTSSTSSRPFRSFTPYRGSIAGVSSREAAS